MLLRSLLVVGSLLLAGVACSDDSRVDDLELRVEALEERATPAPLTVVNKQVTRISRVGGTQVCIDFVGFGRERTTCVTSWETDHADVCFEEAKIGEPLPDSCR